MADHSAAVRHFFGSRRTPDDVKRRMLAINDAPASASVDETMRALARDGSWSQVALLAE